MKISTFVVLVLFPLFVNSQKLKMKALGPIEMIVSYEMEQLCDYPNQWNSDDWREKSTLLLEIGKGMTHSYVVEEREDIVNQFIMNRDKNRWKVKSANIHALLGETFMNHPCSGMLTQIIDLDAAGIYQYVEPVPDLEWKISSKHKTVMGYKCQSATVEFRGREYEVWYTIDIPLSFGPWKFQGLPGLILEVTDSKNEFRFTANGIKHVKGANDIMIYDEQIREIKRSRALKMEAMLHKDHGAYAADYGINYHLGDGMEHEAQPYYPIELK